MADAGSPLVCAASHASRPWPRASWGGKIVSVETGSRLSALVALLTVALAGCSTEPTPPEEDGSTGDPTATAASSSSSDGDSGSSSAGACVHEPHLPEGALAFYDFEGQGAVVTDVSGHGHDGTFEGPTASRGQGRFCTGLVVEGDDAVVVPDHDDFDFVDGYTLEMWVLLPEPDSSPRVHKGATFTVRASHRGLSYVAHEPCISGGGTYAMGFETDRWYHIAGTWDGMMWRYYVDAVEAHATACTSAPLLEEIPLRIGQGVGASMMDDVALFDHVRGEEQICADARGVWDGVDCTWP